MQQVTRVLRLSSAFWATGSLICYGFACLNFLVKANRPNFSDERRAAGWLPVFCFALGVCLGLLQGLCVFRRLARRDCLRIASTTPLRWHHFFRKAGLLAVLCVAVSCAVVEKLTEQYWASVMIFTVLLGCIGTSLAIGAATVASAARASEYPGTGSAAAAANPRPAVRNEPLLHSVDGGGGGAEAAVPVADALTTTPTDGAGAREEGA